MYVSKKTWLKMYVWIKEWTDGPVERHEFLEPHPPRVQKQQYNKTCLCYSKSQGQRKPMLWTINAG